MELENIEQLLKGKATQIKKNNYFETARYVEPFLEKMSKYTNDFRIQVALPDQITKTIQDNAIDDDITYNRVWIQAVMPEEYCFDNHDEVVGMVYGLDVRKPIAKIYRGGLNRACTNLCVFSPSFLNVQEIKPETALDFSPVDNIMQQEMDLRNFLHKLHSIHFQVTEENINHSLGKWIRNSINLTYNNGYGNVKMSATSIISAYKDLFEDNASPYFVNSEERREDVSYFDIYQAMTQQITDDERDIMNKAEKTLLLKNIINI